MQRLTVFKTLIYKCFKKKLNVQNNNRKGHYSAQKALCGFKGL